MKRILFYGLAVFAAAGISSCSNDEVQDFVGGKPLEEDQSFFVNVDIQGSESITRANEEEPGFDKGFAEENNVNTIYLVFYDENGDRVSTTQVRKERAENAGNADKWPDNEDGTVPSPNSFYKGVVQIDVKHGSLPPAYVMAFINPISSQNFEISPDFASLDAVSKTTRPKIIDDNNNFAMSKSVYYGLNRVSGNDHEKIVATPLVSTEGGKYDKQLFGSREEALDALDKNKGMVDIYVERYAAKVHFELADAAKKPILKDIGGKNLTFVPEYWAVNAFESDTYIVKSFLKKDAVTQDGTGTEDETTLSWGELNLALGSTSESEMPWYWNSEDYHRCYWAQTPAYYANEYPRTADDLLDAKKMNAGVNAYPLGYYTYNEIKNNANGRLNAKARSLTQTEKYAEIYARENTVSGKSLQDAYEDPFASPKAAIASVVLVGHYDVEGIDVNQNECFYVMGNATNGYTFFTKDDMLNYFVNTTIELATNSTGTSTFFDYTKYAGAGTFRAGNENQKWKDYFVIEHPKEDVRYYTLDEDGSGQIIDSRYVTIQLDPKKVTGSEGLFAFADGVWTQVTPDNINYINQQMFFAAGLVQGFQGGKVYYTIPIKHLGFYRSSNKKNANKNPNDKNFDWKEVRSGDFGLVRNHSYSIIVDEITGLGNAIPDPDVPIVPPTDPEEYFIGARIIVLNWAVVPPQHVTL